MLLDGLSVACLDPTVDLDGSDVETSSSDGDGDADAFAAGLAVVDAVGGDATEFGAAGSNAAGFDDTASEIIGAAELAVVVPDLT